jgi:hypothetical protein
MIANAVAWFWGNLVHLNQHRIPRSLSRESNAPIEGNHLEALTLTADYPTIMAAGQRRIEMGCGTNFLLIDWAVRLIGGSRLAYFSPGKAGLYPHGSFGLLRRFCSVPTLKRPIEKTFGIPKCWSEVQE